MGRSFGLALIRSRSRQRKRRGPLQGLNTSVFLSFADLPRASFQSLRISTDPRAYVVRKVSRGGAPRSCLAVVVLPGHKWALHRSHSFGGRGPFLALPPLVPMLYHLGSGLELRARLRTAAGPLCHRLVRHVRWKYRRPHQLFLLFFLPVAQPRIGL